MKIDVLQRMLTFVALLLIQVLVLNSVQLFGCATPLLYVYFVIMFPRSYPRWGILLWSFALGLLNDMFANTPGVATASLTLAAFVQPWLLELCLPRDAEKELKVSATTLGKGNFALLSLMLTAIFCLTFFTLEMFQFTNIVYWLACVGGSTVFTWIIILTLEKLRS